MTLRPLSGSEAQIFDFLAQVVAIGERRRTWDAEDVWRVCDQHLPHPRPQPMPFTVKAEPQRTVDLTQTQIDVLTHICRGQSRAEVGRRLGLSLRAVSAHVQRITHAMDVATSEQAVALVLNGQVAIRRRRHGRKAAA